MNDSYANLTHDAVLNAVETVIGEPLANLVIARNSYINRVYELIVKSSRQPLIVKFYRPGRWTVDQIQEEHTLLAKMQESELLVIPPMKIADKALFVYEGISFAIFPKMGGRALDEFTQDSWTQLGRLLGRTHALSQTLPSSTRIKWHPDEATKHHLDILLNDKHLPEDYRQPLERVVAQFLQVSRSLFSHEPLFLIHGDCHKGNLIHRPNEGVYLIDFDDCCVGPAVQDLWMLLPGTVMESPLEIDWFLEGYEVFRDFDRRSLALIPSLTIMRLLHFASWCALQTGDIGFRDHFPDWGTPRYWNELIREIQRLMIIEE
jgi:Ser/Thr protein kinase RdoA (MazF antagonist)